MVVMIVIDQALAVAIVPAGTSLAQCADDLVGQPSRPSRAF